MKPNLSSQRKKRLYGLLGIVATFAFLFIAWRPGFLYDKHEIRPGEPIKLAGSPLDSVTEYGICRLDLKSFADGIGESFHDVATGPCYVLSRGPDGAHFHFGLRLTISGKQGEPSTISFD